MATADSPPPEHEEDDFVLELKRVRKQIKQNFTELVECVKEREFKLLKELDTILAYYRSYRDEAWKHREKQQAIEKTVTFLREELKSPAVREMHENILKVAEDELKSIKFLPKMVSFVCENDRMFAGLNMLGELVEKVRPIVDYKSKVYPVVSVCEKGNGMEQLSYPRGITVDNKTGNIYVTDYGNHCVKVFDSSGNILFKFGDSDGEGMMLHPTGLVISGDRILVSNAEAIPKSNHCIVIFQKNGAFVSKIDKHEGDKIEFGTPLGLACDEWNGDIYICERDNNRVQILSKELQFKSQFGADKFKYPRDVKLSLKYIFILDESSPCIHLYDYDLILQKSVFSSGEGMQIVHSKCLFLDNYNNILISDHGSNSIQVFNPEFELIHEINTSVYPMGVAVDNQGRILVVCRAEQDCLQIF